MATFNLIRVDERLIHGQVLIGWTKSRGITKIIAVDDDTAANSFQVRLLKMATPPGVKSEILSVEKAKAYIEGKNLAKTLLLVKNVQTLHELVEKGFPIDEVNIGNLLVSAGKKKLLSHVYADDEEIALWKDIDQKGIRLYAQTLPNQPSVDFNNLLKGL